MDNVLGSRMKDLREQQDTSQKQLAEQLGMTNVQLSRYESGDRKPDPDTIARIAEFFQVTTDFLLGAESSIRDPKTAYLTAPEQILLEKIKQFPELEKVFREVSQAPDHKKRAFIKMWSVIRDEIQ